MKREQMVEKALEADWDAGAGTPWADLDEDTRQMFRYMRGDVAAALVDVLLPQVTTVEDLEALPNGTVLVGESGFPYWLTSGDDPTARTLLLHNGPLTVVWSPS